jgi:hypothetical protein
MRRLKMNSSTVRKTTSALLVAMIIAPAALAGGSSSTQDLSTTPEPAAHVSPGATEPQAGLAAEAAMRAAVGKARTKQALMPSMVLVRTNSSFHWSDAGIGAAAAAGAILLLLGALIFARTPRANNLRPTTPQLGTTE